MGVGSLGRGGERIRLTWARNGRENGPMSYLLRLSARFSLLLLLAVFAGTIAQAAEAPRKWTNTAGKSVTGSLVEKGDGWVKVEIKSTVHRIKLDTLSEADQEYVKNVKISKDLALRVSIDSQKPGDMAIDERTIQLELEGVDDRKLYCLLVWISQVQSGQGSRIKHVVEAFYKKDGKYTHKASFSDNKKSGQIYRGYAVRILDSEGQMLAETASPSSNLDYLDKARTNYKPKPKNAPDKD